MFGCVISGLRRRGYNMSDAFVQRTPYNFAHRLGATLCSADPKPAEQCARVRIRLHIARGFVQDQIPVREADRFWRCEGVGL